MLGVQFKIVNTGFVDFGLPEDDGRRDRAVGGDWPTGLGPSLHDDFYWAVDTYKVGFVI